jgi:transcriptional regulator with XRE-family HTH domain
MSRFSRAFDAALKSSKPSVSQAEAAVRAGYHPSLVSRVLSGRSTLTPDHVSKLLAAINNSADRDLCVAEFLLDQCPEDYRDELTIKVGKSGVAKARGKDRLTQDLTTLEELATDQPDLRRLISLLLSIVSKSDDAAGEIDRTLAGNGSGRAPTPRRGTPAARA